MCKVRKKAHLFRNINGKIEDDTLSKCYAAHSLNFSNRKRRFLTDVQHCREPQPPTSQPHSQVTLREILAIYPPMIYTAHA